MNIQTVMIKAIETDNFIELMQQVSRLNAQGFQVLEGEYWETDSGGFFVKMARDGEHAR